MKAGLAKLRETWDLDRLQGEAKATINDVMQGGVPEMWRARRRAHGEGGEASMPPSPVDFPVGAAAPGGKPDQVAAQLRAAGASNVGRRSALMGFEPGMPVLIVPGFMSSGLEIRESACHPEWVGKRVWMDLSTLGLEAVSRSLGTSSSYPGLPQAPPTQQMPAPDSPAGDDDGGGSSDSDGGVNQGAADAARSALKNAWIRHMLLAPGGWDDPPGIRVRPVEGNYGLDAVEYLAKGMMHQMSWVFAGVVQQLRAVGYEAGKTLRAAPYDWRLPPSRLEARDRYFSRLRASIEELSASSGGRGVALLSHSMGCKIVHYFMQWLQHVAMTPEAARAWLAAHVGLWIPVGAPFLGAPVTVRGCVSGDYMGLEAFLNLQEALVFGRALGSCPFLFPYACLTTTTTLPATFYTREDGLLFIDLNTTSSSLGQPDQPGVLFYAALHLDKTKLRSRKTHGPMPPWRDRFLFVLSNPAKISGTLKYSVRVGRAGVPKGMYELLYKKHSLDLASLGLQPNVETEVPLPLGTAPDAASLLTTMTWVPASSLRRAELQGRLAQMAARRNATGADVLAGRPFAIQGGPGLGSEGEAPHWNGKPPVELLYGRTLLNRGKADHTYMRRAPEELMALDGMEMAYRNWQDNYLGDPAYGVGGRAMAAPPVRRVFHIYGVKCDTEVGTVYKYRNCRFKQDTLTSVFEMDGSARLAKGGGEGGYDLHRGILKETAATQQVVADTGEVKAVSGDGTVPYASLRYCMAWRRHGVDVDVAELPGALHRDILNEPNMHELLLGAVCRMPYLRITLDIVGISTSPVLPENLQGMYYPAPGGLPNSTSNTQVYVELDYHGRTFHTDSIPYVPSPLWAFDNSRFVFGMSKKQFEEEDSKITVRAYNGKSFHVRPKNPIVAAAAAFAAIGEGYTGAGLLGTTTLHPTSVLSTAMANPFSWFASEGGRFYHHQRYSHGLHASESGTPHAPPALYLHVDVTVQSWPSDEPFSPAVGATVSRTPGGSCNLGIPSFEQPPTPQQGSRPSSLAFQESHQV